MNAVVVEVNDKYASVLAENGQFIKIKNDGYSVGMTLVLDKKNQRKNNIIKLYATSIAAAAAILLAIIGIKDFNTPYGIVSIDVNPSVEITINRYDRVLSLNAVNEDAEEIVNELSSSELKYKKIDTATDIILDHFEDGNYESENGTTFVVLSANSIDEEYSEQIVERLETVSSEHDDISAQFVVADDELVKRAKEAGTTAGKMYLVDQLRDACGQREINENEWIDKPVKEIVREINNQHSNNASDEMPIGQSQIPDNAESQPPMTNEMPGYSNDIPMSEFDIVTPEINKPEQNEDFKMNDGNGKITNNGNNNGGPGGPQNIQDPPRNEKYE